MLFKIKPAHWLFISFWVYAFLCLVGGFLHHIPNATLSVQFIAGVSSILLVSVVVFVHHRAFEIVLFFFLVASAFYLEFNPYAVTVYTFTFNSVTLFAGKVIPFFFLLVYLYIYRKPIIHFVRTTKLWND